MDDNFKKYPDIEIRADGADPVYRLKYTECVVERGAHRFVRHERTVPKMEIESLLADLIRRAEGRTG